MRQQRRTGPLPPPSSLHPLSTFSVLGPITPISPESVSPPPSGSQTSLLHQPARHPLPMPRHRARLGPASTRRERRTSPFSSSSSSSNGSRQERREYGGRERSRGWGGCFQERNSPDDRYHAVDTGCVAGHTVTASAAAAAAAAAAVRWLSATPPAPRIYAKQDSKFLFFGGKNTA